MSYGQLKVFVCSLHLYICYGPGTIQFVISQWVISSRCRCFLLLIISSRNQHESYLLSQVGWNRSLLLLAFISHVWVLANCLYKHLIVGTSETCCSFKAKKLRCSYLYLIQSHGLLVSTYRQHNLQVPNRYRVVFIGHCSISLGVTYHQNRYIGLSVVYLIGVLQCLGQ